jgi:hypothetical protein
MVYTRRIRAAVTVGAAAVALTATAGCGAQAVQDAAKKASPADLTAAVLTRVTERTKEIGSAEVTVKTDLGSGSPITMTGTYSWGEGAAYDVMMDTAAAQMQSVQDDPQLRALMVDGAYYYNVDPQPSGPLVGKHWMRVDVAAVLGEEGARTAENNADPTAGLRFIGLSKADDLGEQTVGGKKAHHYHARIDKDLVAKGELSPEEKKTLLNSLTGPVDAITVDVWVDDKDLPVRLVQEMGNVKMSMDFRKFGSAKAVTAPPVSDTADLSDEVRDSQAQG